MDYGYLNYLMDAANTGGPGSGKARAELKRLCQQDTRDRGARARPLDASKNVRATIAVSVTVKIDAHGATSDALVNHAVNSAMSIIEDGLAATYKPSASVSNKYVWATFSPGVGNVESTISVEGATALVNTAELEKLFEEQS